MNDKIVEHGINAKELSQQEIDNLKKSVLVDEVESVDEDFLENKRYPEELAKKLKQRIEKKKNKKESSESIESEEKKETKETKEVQLLKKQIEELQSSIESIKNHYEEENQKNLRILQEKLKVQKEVELKLEQELKEIESQKEELSKSKEAVQSIEYEFIIEENKKLKELVSQKSVSEIKPGNIDYEIKYGKKVIDEKDVYLEGSSEHLLIPEADRSIVRISRGFTKNLGDFQSMRFDISIEECCLSSMRQDKINVLNDYCVKICREEYAKQEKKSIEKNVRPAQLERISRPDVSNSKPKSIKPVESLRSTQSESFVDAGSFLSSSSDDFGF